MDLFRVFVMVLVGLSGDPEHGELFRKWGDTMVATAGTLGIPKDRVTLLGEESTKVDVERAVEALSKQATADDLVFVLLIGHGSFDGKVAKFNLKGPDLSGEDFSTLLKKLPVKRVVFADTTSASGPFKEALAGPGRTVITATRSGAEQYATLFPRFFIDAFVSDAADVDKNHRVTMQEAFGYAQREVTKTYEREGLLATEHAVMDDTGALAATFALGTVGASALPTDPKLRALYEERREMEQRVEALKVLKSGMDPARYASELEKLVTALALKSRDIRQAEARP